MRAYALSPLAKADIFDIWSHIAEDSEDAANRVEQAIYDACMFVAEAPLCTDRIPPPCKSSPYFTEREILAGS